MMKKVYLFLFVLTFSGLVQADDFWDDLASKHRSQKVSPFPSLVEGLDIPNTSLIGEFNGGYVIRSQAPLFRDGEKHFQQAIDFMNVDRTRLHVLVFKPNDRAVRDEKRAWKRVGLGKYKGARDNYRLSERNFKIIPFPWKGLRDFTKECTDTVEALRFIKQYGHREGHKVLFHCTVGEDRTGVLSGLYRMLTQDWSIREAFEGEMCAHGYGAGNPNKPYKKVVRPIQETLTPFYLRMAYLVEQGELNWDSLDDSVCDERPYLPRGYEYNPKNYVCEPQDP